MKADYGTINNPLQLSDLADSFIASLIEPGDTIYLRGGEHQGNFVINLCGNEEHRITIRPRPGEEAIIVGSLTLGNGSGDDLGSYVDIRNLHIKQDPATRWEWTDPDGLHELPSSFMAKAHHTRLINCFIHDGGVGIEHWASGNGGVVYGNIVFNNGWANTGGAGQSIYIQNQGAGKTIKHNIFGPSFKNSFACYGKAGATENIDFLGNVLLCYQATPIIGGSQPFGGIAFNDNHIVHGGLKLGYINHQNTDIEVLRNRIYAPVTAMAFYWYLVLNSQNNVFIGDDGESGLEDAFEVAYPDDPTGLAWTLNNNTYYYTGNKVAPFEINTVDWYTWAEWQALGYDVASTFSTGLPAANETFVYANEYPDADDPRMGIVVIWNWQGLETVSVDLTSLNLQVGETYRWRQAQDPLVDVGTFVADDNPVSFAMTGHTVAQPTGYTGDWIASQFPTFGTFVIEKV